MKKGINWQISEGEKSLSYLQYFPVTYSSNTEWKEVQTHDGEEGDSLFLPSWNFGDVLLWGSCWSPSLPRRGRHWGVCVLCYGYRAPWIQGICHQNQLLRLSLTKSLCLQKFSLKGLHDFKENSLGGSGKQSAGTQSCPEHWWSLCSGHWEIIWLSEAIGLLRVLARLRGAAVPWPVTAGLVCRKVLVFGGSWGEEGRQQQQHKFGCWVPPTWGCFPPSSSSQGQQGNQNPAELKEGGR